MSASPDPRANPLALGPLQIRVDVARAAREIRAPPVANTSPGGARVRLVSFAADFQHWFAPDGAAIPYGRNLTHRFAMGDFWGALAWANVESPVPWSRAKGLLMRHLRWWAQWPISDRDGVLPVGLPATTGGWPSRTNRPRRRTGA